MVTNSLLSNTQHSSYRTEAIITCINGYWFSRNIVTMATTCMANGRWTDIDKSCKGEWHPWIYPIQRWVTPLNIPDTKVSDTPEYSWYKGEWHPLNIPDTKVSDTPEYTRYEGEWHPWIYPIQSWVTPLNIADTKVSDTPWIYPIQRWVTPLNIPDTKLSDTTEYTRYKGEWHPWIYPIQRWVTPLNIPATKVSDTPEYTRYQDIFV